jgi:hypothetical protein
MPVAGQPGPLRLTVLLSGQPYLLVVPRISAAA